jgi:hypothetical protein
MRLRLIHENMSVSLDDLPEPSFIKRKPKRQSKKPKTKSINFKFSFDGNEHDLTSLTPDAIHDYGMCKQSYSIIYAPHIGGIYVSEEGQSHADMMNGGYGHYDSYAHSSKLQDEYYSPDSDKSIFGRIGQNLVTDAGIMELTVVSFYASEHSHKLIPGALDALLDEGHITEDAIIIHGNEITKVSDVRTHGASEASPEAKERAILQVANHTGSWPDGRRLTPEEKKWIRAKLGMVGSTKNKWQKTGEELGMVPKGSKYWALTSESRRSG